MSKISIKATVVANGQEVGANNSQSKRTPVVTRVQQSNNQYTFVNTINEVRSLVESGSYAIFVNSIRGKDNDAPFEKGQLCASYKEAIEYIATNSNNKYRIDLVLRNRQYSKDELEAIASSSVSYTHLTLPTKA